MSASGVARPKNQSGGSALREKTRAHVFFAAWSIERLSILKVENEDQHNVSYSLAFFTAS